MSASNATELGSISIKLEDLIVLVNLSRHAADGIKLPEMSDEETKALANYIDLWEEIIRGQLS